MWSLEQWLAHQSQVHPQAIDLGLERLAGLLQRLAWQQPDVPVITVAGTNGKGSVTAYCAAILTAAGHRVGTFTSPHLLDYRERIRIQDVPVDPATLIEVFERIEAARIQAPALALTFFEYNAAAAFLIFEAARLDAWILEVGLGGRLDAVNIVDPDVAVVVSIGLDHQEYLGTTLEAIAREKAGIFRRDAPAVLGARGLPAAIDVWASEVGAILKRPGIEYDFARTPSAWHYLGLEWDLPALPPPGLAGDTQFANAATALAALEELRHVLTIPASAIAQGIASTRLPGRFQVIAADDEPTWILDVAHNPAAALVLAANLQALPAAGKTFAVCGILADKDAPGIATALQRAFDAWWVTSLEGARGTDAKQLAAQLAAVVSVPLASTDSVAAACGAARAAASATDRIVVFGSFHTVGPALEWLNAAGLLPARALPEYTAAPSN